MLIVVDLWCGVFGVGDEDVEKMGLEVVDVGLIR